MGKILSFNKHEKAVLDIAPLSPDEHRAELKMHCSTPEFPAAQYADGEFMMATIDKAGHERLKRMFAFFGVTDLDPSGDDFETVLNTWFVLSAVIGEDLQARELFNDTVYVHDVKRYCPEYLAYFNALWDGDRAGVLAGAKALNITRGMPEGSPYPRISPLPR